MEKNNKSDTKKTTKEIVMENFSKVVSMVEDGYNIYEALKKLGIKSQSFYGYISKQQKAELQMAKTLNTKYGVGSRMR
jgi:hypothetical protein